MDYFVLHTLTQDDPDLCILRNGPQGIEHITYKMMSGEPIRPEYPDDAQIAMSEKEDGMVLGGLISNTCSLFIVTRAVKDLILAHDRAHDQLECLPVKILNHKKRVASSDYFIINPLGTEDCLDQKRSIIKRTKKGSVIAVKEMVLDERKINPDKALFRPKENHHAYIARADWVRKLPGLKLKHGNFSGIPLELST